MKRFFIPLLFLELVFIYFYISTRDGFYLILLAITSLIHLNIHFKIEVPKIKFAIDQRRVNTILKYSFLTLLLIAVITSVSRKPVIEKQDLKIEKKVCNEQSALLSAKQCVVPIIRDDEGHGSGFSVQDNFIITNKHVIEGATNLHTKISGQDIDLKVWNYSPSYDIAVLKIARKVKTCEWADSDSLPIAEPLYAVGYPIEYEGESTVSKGVFSRLFEEDSIKYIQTDTSINPGNSGGPLLNKCGIVGVNTSKFTAEGVEGLGYALPSSELIKITNRLIADGSNDTEIPLSLESTATANNGGGNSPTTPKATTSLNPDQIRLYLNQLYGVRDSWKTANGQYNSEDINKLLDLFNRQIIFCETLLSRVNPNNPSQDDIFMWDTVVKLSYESSALAAQLIGK